jgi:toxin ParE1/3/4
VRYRLSRLAETDIAEILATSVDRWGPETAGSYAALLAAAMRKVAADPLRASTRERSDLASGLRSFPIRLAEQGRKVRKIKRPAHVLYYRAVEAGLVEIVRVLHERMDAPRHFRSQEHD